MVQKEFLDLQKITFPIDRGDLSVAESLNCNVYKEYNKIIQEIPSLKDDSSNINELCKSVVETLHLYDAGKVLSAYETFYEAIDRVHNHFNYSFIENTDNIHGSWEGYFRIREYKPTDNLYSALEMLHLPFTKRDIASAGRFSTAGTPCSYMSLQDCLAWLECGCPESFGLMKISISPSEKKKHKLLRLDIRPHEYFRLDGFNNNSQQEIREFLINLCYTLPLTAACSFVCKHKDAKFKEEYIIPQLLLSWIKEKSSYCIGVRYNSSTDNEQAYSYGGHNIAIPIFSPGEDGYCTKLQGIFDLENANVDFYDVVDHEKLPLHIREYLNRDL
jgi:hypothetical protein